MAKKIRTKMYCEKCKKNTVHETRSVDDEEVQVCLKCEIRPEYDPKEQLKNMNRMNLAEKIFLGRNNSL
jgi:hypothetical protein